MVYCLGLWCLWTEHSEYNGVFRFYFYTREKAHCFIKLHFPITSPECIDKINYNISGCLTVFDQQEGLCVHEANHLAGRLQGFKKVHLHITNLICNASTACNMLPFIWLVKCIVLNAFFCLFLIVSLNVVGFLLSVVNVLENISSLYTVMCKAIRAFFVTALLDRWEAHFVSSVKM